MHLCFVFLVSPILLQSPISHIIVLIVFHKDLLYYGHENGIREMNFWKLRDEEIYIRF
jgi:hypothetical protein